MDSVYNALDLLNIGPPDPLRYSLAQLDGEIYADVSSVSIGVGKMFVDLMRDQTHAARSSAALTAEGLRPWVSGFGGAGALYGNGNSHSVSFGGGGVAAGADYRFAPNAQAGVALGYMQSSLSTDGISGSGGMASFAVGTYAGYAAGLWYLDTTLGYSYNSSGINRSIVFPGVVRSACGGRRRSRFSLGRRDRLSLSIGRSGESHAIRVIPGRRRCAKRLHGRRRGSHQPERPQRHDRLGPEPSSARNSPMTCRLALPCRWVFPCVPAGRMISPTSTEASPHISRERRREALS